MAEYLRNWTTHDRCRHASWHHRETGTVSSITSKQANRQNNIHMLGDTPEAQLRSPTVACGRRILLNRVLANAPTRKQLQTDEGRRRARWHRNFPAHTADNYVWSCRVREVVLLLPSGYKMVKTTASRSRHAAFCLKARSQDSLSWL